MQRLVIVAAALAAALPAQKDIVATAAESGQFTTLVNAVKAADLVATLQGEGPFTVFAPTDAAFAKLDQHVLGSLLQRKNRGKLQALLTYHVVPGALQAEDVLARVALDTVNGQRLAVMMNGDDVRIGGAGLVSTDIACTNGVIHIIDTVLQPETRTIPAVAKAAGSFETLLVAAEAARLVDALSGKGPLTVLAPTDEAFAKLPKGTVEDLLLPQNRDRLAKILTLHVIPARVFAEQAVAAGNAKTLNGASVRFGLTNGRLQVQDATVISTDIAAGNGVIHAIDRVLLPPQPAVPQGRLVVGVNIEQPDAALAAQLGIDRNQSLLVTGVTEGSGAEAAGLKRYDVLVAIDGVAPTEKTLAEAKAKAGYEGQLQVEIIRRGKRQVLPVTVGVEKH